MLERGARAPNCFSGYERGDKTCDGVPTLKVAPCLFRDRCLAARMAREDGLLPEHKLVRSGHIVVDGLGALLIDVAFKYQIRDGLALRRSQGAPRLSLQTFTRAPSEHHARQRAKLDRLVGRYFRRISTLGQVDLYEVRREAEQCSLFIDDFEGSNGYTKLGFRAHGLKYITVTRIWKRQYRSAKVIVDLPWPESVLRRDLSKSVMETVRFMLPPRHSALMSRVANVGRIAADALAEMLAEDIRAGRFLGNKQTLKDRA